jgi:hypothetical protein
MVHVFCQILIIILFNPKKYKPRGVYLINQKKKKKKKIL